MNDFKQYARRIVIAAAIIVVGFLLQTSVFSRFQLASVSPNVILCIVATYGFMKGKKKGILVGFFSGLLLDIFSGSFFGLYALIYMYIGFINGLFRKQFYGDDLKLPLILIGTSDLLYGIVSYVALFLTRGRSGFGYYLVHIIFPELIYTIFIAIFVYYIILHISNIIDKLEKKGSDRFGTY